MSNKTEEIDTFSRELKGGMSVAPRLGSLFTELRPGKCNGEKNPQCLPEGEKTYGHRRRHEGREATKGNRSIPTLKGDHRIEVCRGAVLLENEQATPNLAGEALEIQRAEVNVSFLA